MTWHPPWGICFLRFVAFPIQSWTRGRNDKNYKVLSCSSAVLCITEDGLPWLLPAASGSQDRMVQSPPSQSGPGCCGVQMWDRRCPARLPGGPCSECCHRKTQQPAETLQCRAVLQYGHIHLTFHDSIRACLPTLPSLQRRNMIQTTKHSTIKVNA